MINPKKVIIDFIEGLNPRNVLDLGCGKLKISKKFLKKRIWVTGIDLRNPNISNPYFNFLNKDIKDFHSNKKYDLIIASCILNFLKDYEAKETINKMKKNTLQGGTNFLICLSEDDLSSSRNLRDFYPSIDELKRLYSDWKIIKILKDETVEESHGNYKPHKHDLIFLLAQKNGVE